MIVRSRWQCGSPRLRHALAHKVIAVSAFAVSGRGQFGSIFTSRSPSTPSAAVTMIIHRHIVFLLIGPGSMALAMAQAAPGADATPTPTGSPCPQSLQVQQTPSDKVPPDWQVRGSDSSYPLYNVGFYEGPPELLVQQVPHRTQRRGKTLHSQWIFTPSTQQYWVACEYFGTSAVATRPLDRSVTGCTAEHDLDRSPPVVKRWSCQSQRAAEVHRVKEK